DATGQVQIIGGNEADFRALLPYLLTSIAPFDDVMDITLYVGEVPTSVDNIPFELIFPDDSTILGGKFTSGENDRKIFYGNEVYFTSSLTPDEVFAFYDGALGDNFAPPLANDMME